MCHGRVFDHVKSALISSLVGLARASATQKRFESKVGTHDGAAQEHYLRNEYRVPFKETAHCKHLLSGFRSHPYWKVAPPAPTWSCR